MTKINSHTAGKKKAEMPKLTINTAPLTGFLKKSRIFIPSVRVSLSSSWGESSCCSSKPRIAIVVMVPHQDDTQHPTMPLPTPWLPHQSPAQPTFCLPLFQRASARIYHPLRQTAFASPPNSGCTIIGDHTSLTTKNP